MPLRLGAAMVMPILPGEACIDGAEIGCLGTGREFGSRHPLQIFKHLEVSRGPALPGRAYKEGNKGDSLLAVHRTQIFASGDRAEPHAHSNARHDTGDSNCPVSSARRV